MAATKEMMKEEYMQAQAESRLSAILGKLDNEVHSEVLVFDDKQLKGIFSPEQIARSKLNITSAKVGHFISHPATVDIATNSDETIRKLLASSFNTLVVTQGEKVKGTINILDVLEMIAPQLTRTKVKDVALKDVPTIGESDRLGKAVQMLHEEKSRHLIIIDEDEVPLGVLSAYDLMSNVDLYSHGRERALRPRTDTKAFKAELPKIDSLPVSNFLDEANRVQITSKASVVEAIELMRDAGRTAVLVSDNGQLLTAKDIARFYYEA